MRLTVAFLVLLLAACANEDLGAPTELLPDLAQAPPSALTVYRAGPTWRLAFLSAVENQGRGPILLEGGRAGEALPTMTVTQPVGGSDGTPAESPVAGTMGFVRSETHRHWHFLDFERYELLTEQSEPIVRAEKT